MQKGTWLGISIKGKMSLLTNYWIIASPASNTLSTPLPVLFLSFPLFSSHFFYLFLFHLSSRELRNPPIPKKKSQQQRKQSIPPKINKHHHVEYWFQIISGTIKISINMSSRSPITLPSSMDSVWSCLTLEKMITSRDFISTMIQSLIFLFHPLFLHFFQ